MRRSVACATVVLAGLLAPVVFSGGPYWGPLPPGTEFTSSRCWQCRSVEFPLVTMTMCKKNDPSSPIWNCTEHLSVVGCNRSRDCDGPIFATNLWYVVPENKYVK